MSVIKDAAVYCFHYAGMKNLIIFLVTVMMMTGCKERTGSDIINTAVIHFAGVFITENVDAANALRIKGRPDIKVAADSIYVISGIVEGFSPMNYPISTDHFNETMLYSGSNPTRRESWKCIEIFIGNKKIK